MAIAVEKESAFTGKAWHGHAPRDDEEARERIIQAAKTCIERDGVSGANISTVAKEVGVTRRTIYRLFESSEKLIQYIAVESTGVTLNKMIARVNKFDTFQQRLVEAMIFLIREIPDDPVLGKYFSTEKNRKINIENAFTQQSLEFSFQMLKMIYPGSTRGKDEVLLRQLAEHMQRLVLALVLAPGPTLKDETAIRQYLERWFIPAVETTLDI